MFTKNQKYIAVAAAGCIILLIFFLKFINKEEEEKEIVFVKTETVEPSNIEIYDIYQGKFVSRQSVDLKSRTTGEITDIKVKAGDKVKKGDVLIQIDSRKQEALLSSYKVKQSFLTTNLQNAEIQYQRSKELYERQTISKQDYENALNAYKKAESDLNENTQLINNESVELDYYTIKAPFSGTIGNILAMVGQMITPDENLLSITQNNPLELNVGVSENRSFDLKKGLQVQVLDNDNNIISTSTISFISPVVDTNMQTILIKSLFDNKDDTLRAEQSVKAKIIYNNIDGITVPFTSIIKMAGQDFVYKVETSSGSLIAKQVQVKLGELQNGRYLIEKGINLGDRIVVQGAPKLYDDAEVTEEDK